MAAKVPPIPRDHIRVHYHRRDLNFAGWKLYAFGDTTEDITGYYNGPVQPAGEDDFGIFFDVGVKLAAKQVGVIIHNPASPGGDIKDPGPDMYCHTARSCEFWVVSGDPLLHSVDPMTSDSTGLQAFWIDRKTVCIPPEYSNAAWSYSLAYSATAEPPENLDTSPTFPLTHAALTADQVLRFPQLNGYSVFELAPQPLETLTQALKSQVLLIAQDPAGPVAYLTGVQIPGVLDDLFFYSGPLGASYSLAGITLRLWAPTAQSVDLLLFDTSTAAWPVQTIVMTEAAGVWSAAADLRYKSRWYLYRITVYDPTAQTVVINLVTDPYSVSLSINGLKSRLIDLDDPHTKPTGWDQHTSPPLASPNDLSIYELHVRDFSCSDTSVPEQHRGTYLAFTHADSAGMRHLAELADAGLKMIHLLPTFHFSSVNEDRLTWQAPGDLSKYAPDATEQQAAVAAIQDADAYNWGYDPAHYMAPGGAYAFDPDARVYEYRQMVQALHATGLRVVQDCVFNHTSGPVLDKVVPGYYYRLDPTGNIYNASCCSDTASEHMMMERLMIDTVLTMSRQYKIDGFRFDLMSFHFVYNMQHIQSALAAAGAADVYLYGEGWNFGETASNQLGPNASQANMYGLGIGTFNDRIRDAIRGGSPFSDLRTPGFATGSDDIGDVLQRADWIRVALTGNLRDYTFIDHNGNLVRGAGIDYYGQPAGYTASPLEVINFCSVHDNQSLFDAIQLKAPAGEDSVARARRQVLALSILALSQGIPFFMAADDLLRSKDFDQNSYNSGDWFNKIDWTYQSNNWGIGLPIASENQAGWPLYAPLLADPAFQPTPADINFTRLAFQEFLRIRMSSSLFHMRTLAEVQSNLLFLNTGPNQAPRVISMLLSGNGRIAVVFNANTSTVTLESDSFANLQLHPIQAASSDPVVRQALARETTLTVPGLTTAVFTAL